MRCTSEVVQPSTTINPARTCDDADDRESSWHETVATCGNEVALKWTAMAGVTRTTAEQVRPCEPYRSGIAITCCMELAQMRSGP